MAESPVPVERAKATTAKTEIRYAFASPALHDAIVAYLEIEITGGGPVEDLLPPDWASMSFSVHGEWALGEDYFDTKPIGEASALHGMSGRARWVRGGPGLVFFIGLYPLGWADFGYGSADCLANDMAPLEQVLGNDAHALLAQVRAADDFAARVVVANAFLEALRSRSKGTKRGKELAAIRAALADPECSTAEGLAERAGLSPTRLVRLTKASYGFTPKLLIRRDRFLRMLHKMEARPYAEWPHFIEEQFVDQSHLIREFNFFMGMSPTRYLALDRPILMAAKESLQRMMGIRVGVDPEIQPGEDD